MTDRNGLVVPAVVILGILVDGGLEAGVQLFKHGEIRDWTKVGKSAAIGGLTAGAGKLVKAAGALKYVLDATISAAGAAASKIISNLRAGCNPLTGVLSAAIKAGITGAAGSKAKATANSSPKGINTDGLGPSTSDAAITTGNKAAGKAANAAQSDDGWGPW